MWRDMLLCACFHNLHQPSSPLLSASAVRLPASACMTAQLPPQSASTGSVHVRLPSTAVNASERFWHLNST